MSLFAAKDVEYLKSVSVMDILDVCIRRILKMRPNTKQDACYEIHVGAAEHYSELCSEDEEEEEQSHDGADVNNEQLLCNLQKGAVIGEGTYGKVYKALDSLGTVYAVKVMKVAGPMEGFSDEYETLKRLTHPNVVRVLEFKRGAGRAEIVMSYWTQGCVAAQIKEFGALPHYTVRKYAIHVLRGLNYLHSCKVLHRDIKPQNMLVDTMGNVALTDFGFAICDYNPLNEATGAIVGTPPYLSPSIVADCVYSIQSDFWAFGSSLLEMATAKQTWSSAPYGEPPFGSGQWCVSDYLQKIRDAKESGDTPLNHSELKGLSSQFVSFMELCFQAESKKLSHSHLSTNPFIAGGSDPHFSQCIKEGTPMYKYERSVALSGDVIVYLSAQRSLLSEAEREQHVAEILKGPVAHASPFSRLDIRRKGEGAGYNNASLEMSRNYSHRKRPAHTLLSMLGRSTNRDMIEPGLPHIELTSPLMDTVDDKEVLTISAQTIDEAAKLELGLLGTSDDDSSQLDADPSALDVYGTGVFRVTIGEIKRLARSTSISTIPSIPKKFFTGLIAFTTQPKYQLFWSAHRATPLSQIGDPHEENELKELLESEIRQAEDNIKKLEDDPPSGDRAWELKKWSDRKKKAVSHLSVVIIDAKPTTKARLSTVHLHAKSEYLSLMLQFAAWRQHVLMFPYDAGFSSAADAKAVLDQSLTELGTGVCVSQQGFFLVDGCDGNHNQLTAKTPQPAIFLSATGLDFSKLSSTQREASKYFRQIGTSHDPQGWKCFLPAATHRLKERLKELYRLIFQCAKDNGAKNLSMLPMGLGLFLSNVHDADKEGVREAYFRAQFELLCEVDWGFEGYYLNPGPASQKQTAIRVLEETLQGSYDDTSHRSYLSCNVVFHNSDAKFLACELSKRRMNAAMLSPCDCASVTLGQIGTFWETGRGNLYSGEEDFISHTTGVLAREGITNVWRPNTADD